MPPFSPWRVLRSRLPPTTTTTSPTGAIGAPSSVQSSAFGFFRFGALPPGPADFNLLIAATGLQSFSVRVLVSAGPPDLPISFLALRWGSRHFRPGGYGISKNRVALKTS